MSRFLADCGQCRFPGKASGASNGKARGNRPGLPHETRKGDPFYDPSADKAPVHYGPSYGGDRLDPKGQTVATVRDRELALPVPAISIISQSTPAPREAL